MAVPASTPASPQSAPAPPVASPTPPQPVPAVPVSPAPDSKPPVSPPVVPPTPKPPPPSDVVYTGDKDMWVVLCSSSSVSGEWSQTYRAMSVHGGCVVQSSALRNLNGVVALAEALAFVPGLKAVPDVFHGGHKLIPA